MRSLIEKLRAEVLALFERRDAQWLLVSCTDADAPIVFKVLLDCERTSRSDIFLLLGAPFENPQQYADAAIRQFLHEYQALCAELVQRKEQPPACLPSSLLDVKLSPARRLSALITAAEQLLPQGRRLLCALWPMNVTDPAAYERLLDALLRPDASAPGDGRAPLRWPERVYLIGRALTRGRPWPSRQVVRTECDFGPAAQARSLQETAVDQQQPEAVRMNALLILAQLDQAHGRTDEAIGKYQQVLAYHRARRNAAMQTSVLLRLGELHQGRQQLAQARACYEQALTPAASHAPACVAQLAKNLGDLALLEQRHAEAAVCYRTWHRLAEHFGDDSAAAAALQKLALAQQSTAVQPAAP